MEPTIELERFATLSAELDAGAQRDELCAREGITVDQWVATQEAWLTRMADETARKRFVLTNRYNAAFVARRRELAHGGPARPKRRAEPAKAAAAPEPAVDIPRSPLRGHPAIAPPPPVVAAEPSFVKAQHAPSYVAPPPIEPPPFVEPAPVVAPPPVNPVKERRPRAATVALPTFTEPVGAPLPFKPGPPPAPPPPQIPADDGTTTLAGPSPLAASRTALPFQPAPPGGPAIAKPTRSEPPPRPPADDLGGTTVTAPSPFAVSRTPLPFQAAASPPATASKSEAPRPPPAPPEPDFGSGTVVGALSPFAAGASPLPFQGSAPAPHPGKQTSGVGLPFQHGPAAGAPAARPSPTTSHAPRLTLEQFASLTAEIAVTPHNAAQIRARYGFDEAGHAAEAEAHNRRFTADKALYTRYLELFQRFRDYVARAQR